VSIPTVSPNEPRQDYTLAELVQNWLVKLENLSLKYRLLIAVLFTLFVVSVILFSMVNKSSSSGKVENNIAFASSSTPDGVTTTREDAEINVHVVGEVLSPGVVVLKSTSRVSDAISAAGGFAEQADLTQLNLAAFVVDGSQIRVPAVGSEIVGPLVINGDTTSADSGVKVNLNRGSLSDFESLPGIGPSLAKRIVDYRESNGAFIDVNDLLSVSGIGPAKFKTFQEFVFI